MKYLMLALILTACTPHLIVKPPAVTVAPGIAPPTATMQVDAPLLWTPTPEPMP